MKRLQGIITLIALVANSSVYAYKEPTHQDMSSSAVDISVLSVDQSFLTDFGLQAFSSEQKFTNPDAPNSDKLTIEDLVRNGARFEDSFPRSLNHFFNPIDSTPLTVLGKELGNTSPDWALEDNGDVDPNINGEQDYSYKKANDYFFKALTEPTEEAREENWGKLFQTLGQVIHHVQDMAQPDHVRNDEHLTDSWYEEYTNDHKNDSYFNALMTGNTYPIPEFPTARDFWTTQSTDQNVMNRRGIADFTNRNFVSKDTIFAVKNDGFITHSEFPLPEPGNTTPIDIAHPDLMGASGQALCDEIKAQSVITFPNDACFMDFVSTQVTDSYTNETTENVRATSYSIFDKKLTDHNLEPELFREDGTIDIIDRSFTLNKFNFKAAHEYLIPRAVAYSAGIINHFFSEHFSVTADPTTEVFKLLNISGDTMYGSFYLYGEIFDDTDNLQLIDTWIIPASGIADGEELNVTIPELSQYKNDFKIIYRGKIGSALLESIDMEALTSQNAVASVQVHSDIYKYTGGVLQPRKFEAKRETTYHYNFRNYTFMARGESSLSPSDFIGNPSIFQVTNYFWSLIGSPTLCIAEEVGTYDEANSASSLIISGIYAPPEHYLEPALTDVTAADCDAIPYGYHTGTWSRGWLSKFGKPPIKMSIRLGVRCFFCDTTTNPFNGFVQASVLNMTKYDSALGGCVDINLGNIHPDVIPSYETYAEYLSKDPYKDIANFIPPQLLDYRCD